MARQFDELNGAGKESKPRSIPYDEFFDIEGLSEEEKRQRIELAEEFEILLLYFFVVFLDGTIEMDYEQMVYEKYVEIAYRFLNLQQPSAYIEEYARQYAYDLVRATKEHEGDSWYTSKDRAAYGAENEAQTVSMHREYIRAVKSGKKHKEWVSVIDNATRKDHVHANGKIIGIFETFKVGDSEFGYPKDMTYNPSATQTVNCRCRCRYF